MCTCTVLIACMLSESGAAGCQQPECRKKPRHRRRRLQVFACLPLVVVVPNKRPLDKRRVEPGPPSFRQMQPRVWGNLRACAGENRPSLLATTTAVGSGTCNTGPTRALPVWDAKAEGRRGQKNRGGGACICRCAAHWVEETRSL
ncbi:hypothetical protein M440DRAFT_1187726 [Trichoderma longibrachiatum ATCC 18648]|uniref:Secreted protein n=1 Tax=Trichoderma longibrachiatum ATCC 18648 TaxID=983965 RepID=A0A2T4C9G4_TRILO|nr:hypothetical protein M440DRAFT_1187726 [Trichoderma longibrachiatum ATCC 18648]